MLAMRSVFIRDTLPPEVLRARQLKRRERYLIESGKLEQYKVEFGEANVNVTSSH